ncbi:PREDICTED: heavy metal-associated isoprenylated plant protein 3-like [Nelumbo nucifera]|uniref:Heavy metal-associated isoprenylated plant protein 3-like n=1 Tax=Nelumbo nucifera TaxID=4432 RepID=A0A1U7ZPQ2_NELNU|nr:PREDICTED: heavy metal-associated isoprenylated plant protein 3-like [Nelumbo nucifera]
MGEEEKKPEEKKVEDQKKVEEGKKPEQEKKEEAKPDKSSGETKEEKKTEESKDSKSSEEAKEKEPPPAPEEIVLRVYMHCEGCAKKVKRSLRGFEGVEDVQTDCRTHKVVVKGKKADPLKVLDRVQKKSHRQVELLTPIPKPPAEESKKDEENKENVKPEEKKEEPQVIIVVLKVHMHCEACSQEIRKRIQRMKGVQAAEPDLKSSQVTVKGVFDPPKLVEYVYKRTGKHAVIVKQEPEKKEEEKGKEGKEEKKEEGGEKEKEKEKGGEGEKKEKKEGEEEAKAEAAAAAAAEEQDSKVEMKKNEFYYYPHGYIPRYTVYPYPYPPQIFSDENPNACSVM